MAYIKPETVLSPKGSVANLKVLHNNGSWSVAELNWNGQSALGVRWNGSDNESGVGTPQSRGLPMWFIVPQELASVIKEVLPKKSEIELAYEAMANDALRETEALEWCNSLIGDNNAEG
jgi:hypothetical protein